MDVYLANVGSRDLQLSDSAAGLLPKEIAGARSARERDRWLLHNLDIVRRELTFPILSQALAEATRKDRVILVATDQQDTSHRQGDTLYAAEIARIFLRDGDTGRPFESVTVISYDRNPACYDDTYNWYRSLFAENREISGCTGQVFGCLTAGTPQLNMGMLMGGMERFGERFVPLYVPRSHETGGSSPPRRLRIVGQLLEQDRIKRLRETVAAGWKRRDYSFTANTLATGLEGIKDTAILRMLNNLGYVARSMQARMDFDFRTARSVLTGISGHQGLEYWAGLEREALQRAIDAAERENYDRSSSEHACLLEELFATIQWKYRRGEWTDFLARVFRYQEGALFLLCAKSGVRLVPAKQSQTRVHPDWLCENPDLVREVERQGINLCSPLNRHVLYHVLTRIPSAEVEASCLSRLDQLIGLRNRSVAAHDYSAVSAERIRRDWGGGGTGDVLSQLAEMHKALGLREPGYLAQADDHVLKMLSQLK